MGDWILTAQRMRRELERIAQHPDTSPKSRTQANEYLFYSLKGVYNYRVRVQHFINNH